MTRLVLSQAHSCNRNLQNGFFVIHSYKQKKNFFATDDYSVQCVRNRLMNIEGDTVV